MDNTQKYRCPCCGYLTLDDGPGRFDICPVCYWEDDAIQSDNPDRKGGANDESLNQARENYKKFGAKRFSILDICETPSDAERREALTVDD